MTRVGGTGIEERKLSLQLEKEELGVPVMNANSETTSVKKSEMQGNVSSFVKKPVLNRSQFMGTGPGNKIGGRFKFFKIFNIKEYI